MQRNDLLAQIEQDYKDKVKRMKYLSRGDNGSVSRVEFVSGIMICIKSILKTNSSALKDCKIAKIMYSDNFDVRCYQDSRYIYFTIPYFPGNNLEDVIRSGRKLSLCSRLYIFLKLIEAVNKMHVKGILHRDLKAPNIIIDTKEDDIDVNIIDFGRSVCIFDHESGKPLATTEDLSLRNTVSHSHSFFHPFWQMVRKMQTQTAPEYTTLTSHLNGYAYEGESVGLRSDYYSLATLFQMLVPEHKKLATAVIYSDGPERNHAYFQFVSAVETIFQNHEKIDHDADAFVLLGDVSRQQLNSLHI